jgi:hypothetical protein
VDVQNDIRVKSVLSDGVLGTIQGCEVSGGWLTGVTDFPINPLTPELNPSAQSCLPRFLSGVLIFKVFTARRFYKSFGVKGLMKEAKSHSR